MEGGGAVQEGQRRRAVAIALVGNIAALFCIGEAIAYWIAMRTAQDGGAFAELSISRNGFAWLAVGVALATVFWTFRERRFLSRGVGLALTVPAALGTTALWVCINGW